jgi:hypothetical protein
LYGLDDRPTSIVEVTEQVWPEVLAWQQRPFDSFDTANSKTIGKAIKITYFFI